MPDKTLRDKYEVVIGLEVHAQLLTQSKIYNSDSTEYGNLPNTNISVITLAHPGTLPKLNKKVVEYGIKMGLACHSEITRYNIFDRKNYFYPDLPKGYQITQDKTPICVGGFITIAVGEGGEKNVRLNRIHIEEDAGKSIHLENEPDTLVDFNRSGVPLIEIVTEPDLRSSDEAHALLTEIRRLVRYLDICDGNMEQGSLRCDANVSVRLRGETELGRKVEVKNMNSFRNVQRAIEHEIDRQIAILENGKQIFSETRTFNANDGATYGMRTKEELNDYRYFPDPDLSPMQVSDKWLEEIRKSMPSLPHELFHRFVEEYGLPEYDAQVLIDSKQIALYFDDLCTRTENFKAASNWVMGPVKSYLNEHSLEIGEFSLSASKLAGLIALVEKGLVSFSVASQQLLPAMAKNADKEAHTLAEEMNIIQESNSDSIAPIVEEVLASFPQKVKEYHNGKKGLIGMFMGEVMKRSRGKADPKVANELLKEKLG